MKFNFGQSKTQERTAIDRPRLILVQAEERAPASRRVALALFLLGSLTAALWAFVIYPRQGAVTAIIDLNGLGRWGGISRAATGSASAMGQRCAAPRFIPP